MSTHVELAAIDLWSFAAHLVAAPVGNAPGLTFYLRSTAISPCSHCNHGGVRARRAMRV
jgi:hypothetical protein